MMKDKREELLLSYKVVKGENWQEKSFKGLNKIPIKHSLYLFMIQG